MFRSNKLLLIIFFFALFLRIVKLDKFPVGFHADEVRVAWNSLSILETGKDDRGNRLSLYYNTFGDYRPTGIFYFTIPSLLLFGKTEFAVRFPSALFGALTVLPLFFFVREISKKEIGYLASLLLAISPWHIEVSRATSEVVISTFFALLTLYFFLKLTRQPKLKLGVLSSLFIGMSFFLYHSIRLLAPFFFLAIVLLQYQKIRKTKNKKIIFFSLIFVFFLTALFSITPVARQRYNQVALNTDPDITYKIERLRSENPRPKLIGRVFENTNLVYIKEFIEQYASYFSPGFLIGEDAKPYRYTTPGAGLLTYFEVLLLLIGLVQIARRKFSLLPLILLLIAPIPSSLTTEDSPNLHRSFLMLPFLIIIEGYGLSTLLQLKKHAGLIKIASFTLLILSFAFFLHMYFVHSLFHKPFIREFELDSSSLRNVGTKEMVIKLEQIKGSYEKIIVTNFPDSPYPWYAFFTGKDSKEFNQYAVTRTQGSWQYGNIVFSNLRCPSDDSFVTEKASKLLIIDAGFPYCSYEAKIKDGLNIKVVDQIPGPGGGVAYALLERK